MQYKVVNIFKKLYKTLIFNDKNFICNFIFDKNHFDSVTSVTVSLYNVL